MNVQRSRSWDFLMIAFLLGAIVVAFVYDSVDDPVMKAALGYFDLALVVFFIGEWGWRVRSNPDGKLKYALRNSWELLGMIPVILPLPTALRALRFLRVIRILRIFKVVGNYLHFWEKVAEQQSLRKMAGLSVIITLIGALLVWVFERQTNPDLVKFYDSLWWAIVTVTTVGYGDIAPMTAYGRIIAVFLMVTGIGIIGALASSMAGVLLDQREEEKEKEEEDRALANELDDTVAGQLTILSDLHLRGRITDAEYDAAKQRAIQHD